jgi:phosphoribosylanthranilate isomerase
MVKVKICGNTTLDDAIAAVQAGADAVGFVFYPKSPRAVEPTAAAAIIERLPPFVTPVGVFVNEDLAVVRRVMEQCRIPLAQLHGDETPQYCLDLGRPVIKAIRVRDQRDLERMALYQVTGFVLDAFVEGIPGGTGVTLDWDLAADAQMLGPVILAGGLTSGNVVEAIRRVRPYGVDVSSGVESSPGVKDHAKVRAFITNAKSWEW